jgi:hypothetical protein
MKPYPKYKKINIECIGDILELEKESDGLLKEILK